MKEMLKAIGYQLKRKGAMRDIFITHNAFGIFSKNSHTNMHNNVGKDKQKYPTEASAWKAAEIMEGKFGGHFSVYKCGYCDGYHIGKDRE